MARVGARSAVFTCLIRRKPDFSLVFTDRLGDLEALCGMQTRAASCCQYLLDGETNGRRSQGMLLGVIRLRNASGIAPVEPSLRKYRRSPCRTWPISIAIRSRPNASRRTRSDVPVLFEEMLRRQPLVGTNFKHERTIRRQKVACLPNNFTNCIKPIRARVQPNFRLII